MSVRGAPSLGSEKGAMDRTARDAANLVAELGSSLPPKVAQDIYDAVVGEWAAHSKLPRKKTPLAPGVADHSSQ